MLCSLDELGWIRGPDEVAVFCDLKTGDSLDDLPVHRRAEVVVGWERAKLMEEEAQERVAGSHVAPQEAVNHSM